MGGVAMKDNITLINVRGMPANTPGVTYLGRSCAGWKGNPLANPYHITSTCTREQAVARYKSWLWGVIQAKDSPAWTELERLVKFDGPLTLGCWCLPQRCHIETVKAAILYLRGQEAGNQT